MKRRQFLTSLTAITALAACSDLSFAEEPPRSDALELPPEKWRQVLTPREFNILRSSGTERAFSGDLWNHKADGVYTCAGCGLPLFDSSTKFKSGTGWPSYFQPIANDRVRDVIDTKYGMIRTENVCARCGGHLGHVFPDGPKPTGLRYCINSYALDFVPRDQVESLKGEPVVVGGVQAPDEDKKP